MKRWLGFLIVAAGLLAGSELPASYHTFQIEQIYSNADGTVQFIVMHESLGANGESFWAGNPLTITHAGVPKSYTFDHDLPGGGDNIYGMTLSPTANRRVLIATQGFAALGLVTPDFILPNGFLATSGGTLNYAGFDSVTYSALPTDGTHAINRTGGAIQNVATNFAGQSGSVAAATAAFTPVGGVWWNPNESGSGYGLDFQNGVLLVQIYSFLAGGPAQWYLAAGPMAGNVFTSTLDKYAGGQCISCAYKDPGPPVGNDGMMTITFTSPTTANVTLPGGRQIQIQRYFQP